MLFNLLFTIWLCWATLSTLIGCAIQYALPYLVVLGGIVSFECCVGRVSLAVLFTLCGYDGRYYFF